MFSRKMFKSRKGFTLVELMIVIAIIGILAVILVPKAMNMKKSAKTSGVEANIRIVQATIEGMIDEYDAKASFATTLATRLDTSITNPINSATAVTTQTSILDNDDVVANSSVVITYATGIDDSATNYNASYSTDSTTDYDNVDGSVIVVLYGNQTSLSGVQIYGIDANGRTITKSSKYNITK